ncbi:hypothetical protein [Perlucidibaca aquatica]|uniref:hypothetical protein n=1 Tax=Perlucidibaca aquatica TaxID=1852776 RepID=UPI0012FD657B|nr:hypothetical protein [Perlucidibaca aquatica]
MGGLPLATDREVSASTQNQAFAALLANMSGVTGLMGGYEIRTVQQLCPLCSIPKPQFH